MFCPWALRAVKLSSATTPQFIHRTMYVLDALDVEYCTYPILFAHLGKAIAVVNGIG